MRVPFIAGNWKMNMLRGSGLALVEGLLAQLPQSDRVEVAVCPPSVYLESIAGALRVMMTRPDSTPLLATIHVPTLIVVGEEDTVTPPTLSREMHQAISGSRLVTIPKAGHLSNLEQPDAFNSALTQFLTRHV